MSIKKWLLVGLSLLFFDNIYSQDKDYIGAGHMNGVTVTSSNDHQLYPGLYTASALNTINGSGLEGQYIEAARFLSQSTFGGNKEEIESFINMGMDNWFTEQISLPPTYLTDTCQLAYNMCLGNYVANGGDSSDYSSRPVVRHVDYAWWNNTMKAKDQLRQRMAYALSEILVISLEGTLNSYGIGISDYYDILIRNAFGNYKDILSEVSLHVAMGSYLSHLNNPKTDAANNIHPDENYAREIMQLFSIGIEKLNIDGSIQYDGNGFPIPTYNNNEIKELAKVFTGLSPSARTDGGNLYFYLGVWAADFTQPMMMYEDYHETGSKVILDGHLIQPGQTGLEDIEAAIDYLFNHPNVGPFLAQRLIQHLVKSNPSPSYVQAVAETFNDNGDGVRGDMEAVLKAILTHYEARTCGWLKHPEQGKLREPVLRFSQFARFFGGVSPHNGRFWNYSDFSDGLVGQHPLHSRTVFNFFSPSYSPSGPLSSANLLGPEFEIHNTRTSVGYADLVYYLVESEILFVSYSSDALNSHITKTDLSSLVELSKDEDALLDHLDLYFCNGELSDRTRAIVKDQLNVYSTSLTDLNSKVRLAVYLIMISPDYVILK